ncbi:GNAT family N-acetyltransferase [Fictibacillus phosphorivorans]|uniref:GNAT family N-acetyltransferase n=1 Tax=Fictibacillus phosphorivorans TaxID=1221500 RepID=UPI00203DA33C|nr:GNAT family N-acetyltransferase [Fictibacillus phosphorivorans]MCM3719004.1 GNAT family N-acetyltransferase [Fictibacillus phosphorivorans]MCM3776626.1 GNAT family N-acetyltransferase [Fictibacillus phosphorivorans]
MEVVQQSVIDQITIVEYDPSYAGRVAEMWNNSRDGWGGSNSLRTEEQVLKQEANSTNLHLYLALDGEKVVGYCSFGEYREDEGALYIPLLNVRDDYHGKKIGKKLVLKAVEKAIEMKWPRLDLYTWPGNTKATPLYKKCGFFWEDRDDTTHLMNFMPSVMQIEAVSDFFNKVDWYENSTRKIEVVPDGKKENDFHYYEYSWETKEQEKLRMEFERFGRGLRLIETDDYLISATVEDFNLVFGSDYKMKYQIINKSGKPLTVAIEGMNDKNIEFQVAKEITVTGEETIEVPFTVNAIDEEQSIWRTHPTVSAMLTINGKKAPFKVGISPKFPLNLSCKFSDTLSFIGNASTFYLDLENNFNEEATFTFELPESELIDLEDRIFRISLAARIKQSVPVPFTLKKHGFYSADLKIKATKKDGSSVVFSKRIGTAFKGIGKKFAGECADYFHVYNGQYHLTHDKFDNWIKPGKGSKDFKIALMHPKLGKPFSEELARIRPYCVEPIFEEGYAGMKAIYRSNAFPGLELASVVKLYGEGLIEQHYEITNTQETETSEEVWLNNPILFSRILERAVLPYEGDIVELNDSTGSFLDYWKSKNITENWIFLRGQNNPRGISWSKEASIYFASWFMYFEHNLGKLAAHQSVETKPVVFSIGAFQDWQSFREYAVQKSNMAAERPKNHMMFSLEDGNPFVSGEECKAVVKDRKSAFFNGLIEIKRDDEILQSHLFTSDEGLTHASFEIPMDAEEPVHVLTSKMSLDEVDITRQTAAFVTKETPVQYEKSIKNELEVLSADNGELKISASGQFAPSLFSLQYKGQEWMDTPFPKPAPKSWWNPWMGGIAGLVGGTSLNSLLKEESTVAFAEKEDIKGNVWKGLRISTKYEKHETFKGLEVHTYFLMLPGVPVLCHTTEIVQTMGSYLNGENFYTGCFLNPGSELTKSWASFQSETGEWTMVYGGKGEQEMAVDRSVVFGSDEHENLLQIVADQNATFVDSYINKEVIELGCAEKLHLAHGSTHFTSPVFYLFSNKVIPDIALEDLKKIRFC